MWGLDKKQAQRVLIDSFESNLGPLDAAFEFEKTFPGSDIPPAFFIDAFARIWKNIKYFKFLSFFIRLPLIYSLAKYAYHIFAEYRFKRLRHCQILE